MKPNQEELARHAYAGVKQVDVSVPVDAPHDATTLSDTLVRSGISNASINPATGMATGFTREGQAAVVELARALRAEREQGGYTLNNATLAEFIGGAVKALKSQRGSSELTDVDVDDLEKQINDWFMSHDVRRQHVVPCTIFPAPVGPIAIGPVVFYHAHDFPAEDFGIPREQFWPEPPAKPGGWQLDHLLEFAAHQHAPYLACVEITGRPPKESTVVADMATDIALAAIQLVSPGADMRGLARATGRAAPTYRVDVSRVGTSPFSMGTSNHQPALARSPDFIRAHLDSAAPLLESMGRRLTAYVHAEGSLRNLEEAWCNAAFWYHEALAEPLDTVAVAKLETAMEVLLRAASMKGSKRRLIQAFDVMLGLKPDDPFAAGPTTSDDVVTAITTARSRILHGTWPTLHTDLPTATKTPLITFDDVERVARTLLLVFSTQMDSYIADGRTEDNTAAFLDWVKIARSNASDVAGERDAAPKSGPY